MREVLEIDAVTAPACDGSHWPRHVVFDRAFPLSEAAAGGADPRTMTTAQLLAGLLITNLEGQGHSAGADLVRAAMARNEQEAGLVRQGEHDDCYRACVATVLGLPLSDVPHFYREASALPGATPPKVPGIYDLIRDWARTRGFAALFLPAQQSLAYVLEQTYQINPEAPFILGGTSIHGTGHAVVVCGGRIVHEPTPGYGPDAGGVVAPDGSGNFELTCFVPLPPWARMVNPPKVVTGEEDGSP